MKPLLRWLLRLIGPALLLFFLWRSDLNALGAALVGVDLAPALLSLALMPVFVWVKAWRWRIIVREQGYTPPSLHYLAALYAIGLYAGGITPGQSGDFIKAWYLRERGVPLGPGLLSILLDRLFDFVIWAVMAVLSLAAFIDVFPAETRGIVQLATIGFAAAVLIATPGLMARAPREWALGLALPLLRGKLRAALERLRDQFAPLSLRFTPLLLLLLSTIGSATSTFVRIYLMYLALRLGDIPALEILAATGLIAILQALPISFAGVGVRDAVLIAMLQRHGHPAEIALSLSALFLLINIQHILIGFLVSLRYPPGETPPMTMAEMQQRTEN
ncbi:lysylphosphatidylglycerol synthase transmembrane domain-containing protein [Roseiflexus sp.]|uniref:lysylphosphatidylglycerol synthase transmembrane domain-containing protein n=1 Tax=Roseiflexus sp. TaxID=2562120 RepID=UPI0021DEE031|nr:lysylphosphatidylglycerol synthase transmembrane domain-containing protein [Roseiflexus sp.]GIW02327.1 MAG: TIGR00374 family protein [Roseiflexus sp.]